VFTWLLYNAICSFPLVVLALVARRVRAVSATVEHVLWLLVLVRLVLPPLPALPWSAAAPAGPTVVATGRIGWGDEAVAWMTRNFGNNWSNEARLTLAIAFVCLLLFLIVREVRRVRTVDRSIRGAAPAPAELTAHVAATAARLRVRAPEVRVLPGGAGPFLWGLRRPVLLFPADRELPSETVLAHEFAHIRRRDHWVAWLDLLVMGFHFWNPLYWIARRRMHLAAELACDSFVVERFPRQRKAYATALVDTVEHAAGPLAPRAAHAIGMDARDFEERLRLIVAGGRALGASRTLIAAGVLASLLSVPGLALPSLDAFRSSLPDLPAGIDRELYEKIHRDATLLLRADPEDGYAWGRLGFGLTGLGRIDEALAAFERQVELGHEVARGLYNQACMHALRGRSDDAVHCLEQAAAAGMPVAEYLPVDPDLASLRDHPGFAALVAPAN